MLADPEVATVTLTAAGLFSRWGFGDGGILGDALAELRLRPLHNERATLCWIVRNVLVPAIPGGLPVVEISTHHNPIRVAPEHQHRQAEIEALGIVVTMSLAVVRDLDEALAGGRNPDPKLLPASKGSE